MWPSYEADGGSSGMNSFVCILLAFSYSSASSIKFTQAIPDELVNTIAFHCGPIEIRALYSTCKDVHRILYKQVYDKYLYECILDDGGSVPRLSLEKCYSLWRESSDELEKSQLKVMLWTHSQFRTLWDCLINWNPLYYRYWTFSLTQITPIDSLVNWIKIMRYSVERPVLALLLEYGQIFPPNADIEDEMRVLSAAIESGFRYSVLKCLLAYLSSVAHFKFVEALKLNEQSFKPLIAYAYHILLELLPRGYQNIYILGSTLFFAEILKYDMQNFCNDFNLQFDTETVNLKLVSKPCGVYGKCVPVDPDKLEAPDSKQFTKEPLSFDPSVLFTLLSTFRYSWVFTRPLLEFCITTYDEQSINVLLDASCTVADIEITDSIVSAIKKSRHSNKLLLRLTASNFKLTSDGFISIYNHAVYGIEGPKWSIETLLQILMTASDKTLFNLTMLTELPKNLPEEYFLAFGSIVADSPEKIKVYMEHGVSALFVKSLLLICKKDIKEEIRKDLRRVAAKYGYVEDFIALIDNASN